MNKAPPTQHIRELMPADLRAIAPLAKTTAGTLRQYAIGRRRMSSSVAIAVEKAGARLGFNLPRELHALGCEVCEFARACRKVKGRK